MIISDYYHQSPIIKKEMWGLGLFDHVAFSQSQLTEVKHIRTIRLDLTLAVT